MSLNYAGKIDFDLGEERHVRVKVQAECGAEEAFVIRNARYELTVGGEIEDSGICIIVEHELDVHIKPTKNGTYELKFIYEIADETWIDIVRIRVV